MKNPKPIKWLTLAQIKAASKKSPKAAFKCSLEHWEQMYAATQSQLRAALTAPPRTGNYSDRCALCQRYPHQEWNCSKCPIFCRRYWEDASNAIDEWFYVWDGWDDCHKKIGKMRNYLRREYRKHYPNG